MIGSIYTSGHLQVTAGASLHISSGNLSVGTVRYNPNSNLTEVYDGYTWMPIEQSITMTLSPAAENAINWVIAKQHEEKRMKELCAKYPALDKAKNNFDLILSIVGQEEAVNG